jgi:hypothetical protein
VGIRDLDLVGISSLPPETSSILLIDPDAVLPAPVCAQPFETIPRGDSELEEIPDAIHLIELPPGHRPHVARARAPGCGGIGAIKDVLSTAVPERPYHGLHYNGSRYRTSCAPHDPHTVGADRVVFGTDWPADMCIDRLLGLNSLDREKKE